MTQVHSKNIEKILQEINSAIKPIKIRYERYSTARWAMRQQIIDYFFTPNNEAKILEVMRFITGAPVQAAAAVNAQLLLTEFETLEHFTQAILECNLGLELERDMFIFNHTNELNKDTLIFMKQFAYALNAYSTCYGLELIYNVVLTHQHINIEPFESYLPKITELCTGFKTGPLYDEELSTFLCEYYSKTGTIQHQLASQYEDINIWKEPFIQVTQQVLGMICSRLNDTSIFLIKANTEFPDTTWRGSNWSFLVKNFINQLFAGSYSHSWWITGSLCINPDYIVGLGKELSEFSFKMQDQMEHLKLALLREASTKVNELMQGIQEQAGINQITLKTVGKAESQVNIKQDTPVSLFYLREVRKLCDDNSSGYSPQEYNL